MVWATDPPLLLNNWSPEELMIACLISHPLNVLFRSISPSMFPLKDSLMLQGLFILSSLSQIILHIQSTCYCDGTEINISPVPSKVSLITFVLGIWDWYFTLILEIFSIFLFKNPLFVNLAPWIGYHLLYICWYISP